MELAKIEINDFGGAPICEHNMPCATCLKAPAVYQLSEGYFEPCWDCQKVGWVTELRAVGFIERARKRFGW